MEIEKLSIRLKEAREALGLKQAELAERWNCNPNTISRIEQGREPGMIGLYADAVRWLEAEAKAKSKK